MPVYRNLHAALPGELDALLAAPRVHSRNGLTHELLHRDVTLLRPQERVQFHLARGANIFAQIAETLWVLRGRNDIEWLKWYLPRAPQFSDDGKVWRAGYGPRLRSWPQMERDPIGGVPIEGPFDQLAEALNLLRSDRETRRAVVSLWDPPRDLGNASRDVPCNNWLQFLIRDNQLHLAIAVRSNDVWWGWSGINTFEWSVLQEAMAQWLGVGVGMMTTFAASWHVYEQHWYRARKVIDKAGTRDYDTSPYTSWRLTQQSVACPRWETPFGQLDAALDNFFRVEALMRAGPIGIDMDGIADPFLNLCARMLHFYNELQRGADIATLREYLAWMPVSDLSLVASLELDRLEAKDERPAWHAY